MIVIVRDERSGQILESFVSIEDHYEATITFPDRSITLNLLESFALKRALKDICEEFDKRRNNESTKHSNNN